MSISSTFYARIFRTEVCSKPNSKQRKAAQKTFVQKCTHKMLMKSTAGVMVSILPRFYVQLFCSKVFFVGFSIYGLTFAQEYQRKSCL